MAAMLSQFEKIYRQNTTPLIKINDNEYIIAALDALWKYNVNNDEWIEWIKYPNDVPTAYIIGTYDIKSKAIYVYRENYMISKIDTCYKKISTFSINPLSLHNINVFLYIMNYILLVVKQVKDILFGKKMIIKID